MAKGKILVVDDEAKIVELVRLYLEKEGYRVLSAGDGKKALELFRKEKADLVVLDIMLPEMDGWEVCQTIRRESNVPIIMLTARSEEVDKLVGLGLGADDYVTKPFSPRELAARVGTVLRRVGVQSPPSEVLRVGDLEMDLRRYEVRCHGKPVELTSTEFKLLSTLARSPGRVFTRLQLLDTVVGDDYEGYERTIDAHIKNLRQKFPGGECGIVTVRGVGYKFQEPEGA